jgi:hypothetical protein
MNNKKVRYQGNLYTIIYDYQNGLVEIKSLNNPHKVLLVNENEICII